MPADHESVSPPNIIRSSAVPRHREEGLRGCQSRSQRSKKAKCDIRGEGAVHGDAESVPQVPVPGQWLPHCPEEQGASADHRPQHDTRGSRVCCGGVLGPRPLEPLHVPDQGHEGARHQVPAHQEQQVPLLLPERPRQSLD